MFPLYEHEEKAQLELAINYSSVGGSAFFWLDFCSLMF